MEKKLRYLRPDEYGLWDSLLDESPQCSVFCRSWYLRAVENDVRVLGYFENGRMVAGIPLYFRKRFGFRTCTMPQLTGTWGVVMRSFDGKGVNVASREMEILRLFAEQLAREKIFFQKFHPSLQNWLPFYWKGFIQTSRFTYVLDDLSDLNKIWQGMRHNIRGEIRKAQDSGLKILPCMVDVVYDAEVKTFARQLTRPPRSLEKIERLFRGAKENDGGECFAAKDPEGRVHAANLLVWDKERAYFLAGGADPALRKSGATSLLLWHMIQFAAKRSKVFDFEGSTLESVEHYFRTFGAKQIPYNWVMKFPVWVRGYLMMKSKL